MFPSTQTNTLHDNGEIETKYMNDYSWTKVLFNNLTNNSFMFYLIQPKNLWIKLDGSQVFATPSLAFLNDTRWSMCEDFETIYDTYTLSSFYCLYNRIDVDTSSIKLFQWIFGSQQWKSCVGIGNDIPHYTFRKSQTSNSKLW